MPKYNSISISGYHMQEAGADAKLEVSDATKIFRAQCLPTPNPPLSHHYARFQATEYAQVAFLVLFMFVR